MPFTRRFAFAAALVMSVSLTGCAEARDRLVPQGWDPQTGAGRVSFYPADGTVRNLSTGAVVAKVPSRNAQDLWMAGDGTVSHLVVRGALGNCPAQHIVISTDGVQAHVERVGRCGERLFFTETRNGMAAVNTQGETWLYPETSNEVRRTGFVVGNGVYRGPMPQAQQRTAPVTQERQDYQMPSRLPQRPPVMREQPRPPAFRTSAPAQGYVASGGYQAVPTQADRRLLPSQVAPTENLWNSPRVDLR